MRRKMGAGLLKRYSSMKPEGVTQGGQKSRIPARALFEEICTLLGVLGEAGGEEN